MEFRFGETCREQMAVLHKFEFCPLINNVRGEHPIPEAP